MEQLLEHKDYLWLAAGVALVALDVLVAGIGFMFAGFAAIMVGTAIMMGVIGVNAHIFQATVFCATTALFAVLLWKPMKRFRVGDKHHEYHNIVGEVAYVGSNGISRSRGGEVTWSGTIMRAQLAKDVAGDSLEAGSQVTIVAVSGATLTVKPKV